jgi:hypothetical protein
VISECLNDASISLLYRSLKPIIRTDETPSRIQKRAYKVMAEICKRYHSFVAEPERLKEVMQLLSSTSATSQVSARFMRLKCLTFVVDGFEDSELEARQVRKFRSSTLSCSFEQEKPTHSPYLTFPSVCDRKSPHLSSEKPCYV